MKTYNTIGCVACGKELDNLQYESRETGKTIEVHPIEGGYPFALMGITVL